MPYRRSTVSTILEVFSLNPLPYPVILILAVIFVFLGLQWYVSYEEVVEAAEESLGWVLMAAPLVLLFLVKWLSSFENPGWWFYGAYPWERQPIARRYFGSLSSEEGSSPWGVAALIVLLLIMVQYQSDFLDSWFI